MVLLKSIITSLVTLWVGRVAAAPADFDMGLTSQIQNPMSQTLGPCRTRILELKPEDWVKALNNLTQQYTELVGPTKNLTAQNAFFVVANEGPFPVILEGVAAAVDRGQEFFDNLDEFEPLKNGSDADSVYAAYSAATKAALFWANILSTKSNDFKIYPGGFVKPIGALGESALRAVFDNFEVLAFAVSDYIPSRLTDVQGQASALSNGFDIAIKAYSAIKLGTA